METIVRLLNSMNPVPKNAHTACPVATFLRQDALRFTYDNGDRWTVYLSYAGCAVAWTHGVAAWNLGGRSRSQTVFGYVMRLFS